MVQPKEFIFLYDVPVCSWGNRLSELIYNSDKIMLVIQRLYTIPETIAPIDFHDGFNLILGEKDETTDKRNGVGKSLCIEFINFALLKRKSDSRVALIPSEIFPEATQICLDCKISDTQITIKRSISEAERPIIVEGETEVQFDKLEDASQYLTEKLFSLATIPYPSFRIMMGPIIRDERSEFKSLINCYDTKLRLSENYSPHLYLLGIDIEVYELIKDKIAILEGISADITKIKENVKLIRQKDIDDVRSDLNELDKEVHLIEKSIDNLENITGFDLIKDDVIRLEGEIEALRRKKGLLKQQVLKLKSVSQKVDIEPSEIAEFYEHLVAGLGVIISKDLKEVIAFKSKIDEFQNKLISERRQSLVKEIDIIDKQVRALDVQYSQHLKVLDQSGSLKNLKQTYSAYKEKSDQLSQLRSFLTRFDELELEKQRVKTEKETHLLVLQTKIQNQKKQIDAFEQTILNIHEFIQGNRSASFQLKPTTKKQVVEIVMRIDSDGSHSVEREKVFIYDIALLISETTQKRHPGFLIHDNIFDVDHDTLVKSLEYVESELAIGKSQYILTLNTDRLESSASDLLERLQPYVVAKYTKASRFLKCAYQQTG